MNIFTRIVCLVLLMTAIILVALNVDVHSQSDKVPDDLIEKAEKISGDSFGFETETPEGVKVLASKKPSKKILRAIDSGLASLFETAAGDAYSFKKKLSHSDYVVFIGKADRIEDSNGNYSPDIAVGAAQYKGSKYDKGGYIYAAGMVLSFSPNAILIADHDSDMQRVSRVIGYEAEHLVLYHNDRDLFKKTVDHSRGGGHPIL